MQVSSPVNVQEMIKAPFFTGASFDREVVNLPYTDPSGQPATVEAVLSIPATPADNGVRRKQERTSG